ncbi:hypothetical protein HJG60_010997 [Phyllostomus discolor]|uniref:Uncharacterized protein n=1 Tax=Phyllostomus discolor TaxID=89673 RepID=A0A834ACC4_9CHIR|nr:hypothetical protein HJG60_010997 [Phyllostomus discolor]
MELCEDPLWKIRVLEWMISSLQASFRAFQTPPDLAAGSQASCLTNGTVHTPNPEPGLHRSHFSPLHSASGLGLTPLGGRPANTVPTRPQLCCVAPRVPQSHGLRVWQRHTGEVRATAPDSWRELSDRPHLEVKPPFQMRQTSELDLSSSPTPSLPPVMNPPKGVRVGAGLQRRAPDAPSRAPPVGPPAQGSSHHASPAL